jgi:hypothetical protein
VRDGGEKESGGRIVSGYVVCTYENPLRIFARKLKMGRAGKRDKNNGGKGEYGQHTLYVCMEVSH